MIAAPSLGRSNLLDIVGNGSMATTKKPTGHTVYRADDWPTLIHLVELAEEELRPRASEALWFRGTTDESFKLAPTLMRGTEGRSNSDHDAIEQDLFFEFQARSPDLRFRNLNDWEYLFYGRHHGVPTRLIDWTDTIGVAAYFALEEILDAKSTGKKSPEADPAIWIMNPYELNKKTWWKRDIVLPRYLGLLDKDYWDYGELLIGSGDWAWDGPVAIYPAQLNDRVRAQRGWFTIHGNSRKALEEQYPKLVWKIVLGSKCVQDGLRFLDWAGFNRFSIYPDYDNLAVWLKQKNLLPVVARPVTKRKKRGGKILSTTAS